MGFFWWNRSSETHLRRPRGEQYPALLTAPKMATGGWHVYAADQCHLGGRRHWQPWRMGVVFHRFLCEESKVHPRKRWEDRGQMASTLCPCNRKPRWSFVDWLIDWNHDRQLINQSINQSIDPSNKPPINVSDIPPTSADFAHCCIRRRACEIAPLCRGISREQDIGLQWVREWRQPGSIAVQLLCVPTTSCGKNKGKQTIVPREKPKTGQFKQQSLLFMPHCILK